MSDIIQKSIFFLFQELSSKKIPVVVLRNYGELPNVGNDLDLAIKREDVSIIRSIFKANFFRNCWSDICEVKTHNSNIDECNIFIFKFFNKDFDTYLQIDFFSGFAIKGQPYFTINDFFKDKRIIKGFPIVSARAEIEIKYFQILNAIYNEQWERVHKYSKQVFELEAINNYFSINLNYQATNKLLKNKNYSKYVQSITCYRKQMLWGAFKKQPFLFMKNVFERVSSFYRFYRVDPFVVKCEFSPKINQNNIDKVISLLIEKNCFRDFFINSDVKLLQKIKKIKKMATSGGVIISYKSAGLYKDTSEEIKEYIILEFVNRHTRIWSMPR